MRRHPISGLISRELSQFRQMKRSAYLINIGRGAIVNLADLTAALESGEIAGAGIDVFETEPLPPGHPLWRMNNVILTPHVAGFAPNIAERHLAVLLDNLGRFASGEPLRNVVNKAMWFGRGDWVFTVEASSLVTSRGRYKTSHGFHGSISVESVKSVANPLK